MGRPIVHFELGGKDLDALSGFYASIFDWRVTPSPEGDWVRVDTGDGSIGGGLSISDRPEAVFYIDVVDIAATLAQIEASGGSTVTGETVIPGIVTYAVFKDPAGNTLGLVKNELPS